MKALVYAGPNKVEVRNVPEPQARDGAVKVKMLYCGLCGSDIGIYSGKHPRAKAPLILGHEFVGIVETAPKDSKLAVGDHVTAYPLISCGECYPCKNGTPHVCQTLHLLGIDCDGAMADYCWVDEEVLVKVPEGISDKLAALAEPLAVVVRALHQAKFKTLDRCVVMGAGPIGILTAILLKHSGAAQIIISDIDEGRLALCREFGFDAVNVRDTNLIDHVNKATDNVGVDIVFECSGVESAALDVTKLTRVGGTICMTGVHKAPHAVDLMDLNFKEQTMVGSRVYTMRELADSVPLLANMAEDLEKVISQVIPLSESDKIFDMVADPSLRTVKVLVDCQA
ncbi:alcohol dehydrogenase catalytic domain-containing protein [uncultured Cohaesibacter sp.]|uniref:zinc-dependent alcohol dehydrogenase n=1 Tax=uncultured Cohaesibacter sp. TaxID=1002546 RepID=UPI002AA89AF2|nr:alcohol dehydrogenase catalytic domain-containing protein [uncultured Cohaesibacter sp.]